MSDKNNYSDSLKEELALTELQKWLSMLYQKDLAYRDDDGVVRINTLVAKRFSLGTVNEDLFIAIHEEESRWAVDLPWHYAAVYRGRKDLHLIARSVGVGEIDTLPFGMSFQLPTASEAKALTTFGSIELRKFASGSKKNGIGAVSRIPFANLPIMLLEHDQSIFEAIISKPKNRRNIQHD